MLCTIKKNWRLLLLVFAFSSPAWGQIVSDGVSLLSKANTWTQPQTLASTYLSITGSGGGTSGPAFYAAGNALTFVGGSSGYQWNTTANNAALMTLSNSGALALPSIPSSAGAGGLYVCVDTAGVFYKSATCP